MDEWREKAHRRIAELCRASYEQTNKGRKRHKPYSVPEEAAYLIRCLERNDEHAAKAVFVYGFGGYERD